MSRISFPWPPERMSLPPNEARWWRHDLLDRNEGGDLYRFIRDGDADWDTATYLDVEWFDAHNVWLDGGLDAPVVFAFAVTEIQPIWYLDLYAVHQPTPDFYPIARVGHQFIDHMAIHARWSD